MLIKIDNKWVAANTVTDLGWVSNVVNGEKTYSLYIRNDGDDCFCGEYNTEEGVIKAMDEAASKINAALGCKPAAREKVVMKYEEHGDEPSIIGVYRCSRCKTVIREEHSWYKFCPACGREIKRWE